MTRYFSQDDIDGIRNARGCQVPWEKIARHMGASVADIKAAVGEPQWKEQEPARASCQRDLFSDQEN